MTTDLAAIRAHWPGFALMIDCSRWQGDVDWPRVRSTGIQITCIKVAEGRDAHVWGMRNAPMAHRAGMVVGYYGFWHSKSGRSPVQICGAWKDIIEHLPESQLPIAIDVEGASFVSKTEPKETQRRDRHNIRLLSDCVRDWFSPGAMVYSSNHVVNEHLDRDATELGHLPLWCAGYGDGDDQPERGEEPKIPKGWAGWVAWQGTSQVVLPGIPENTVDLSLVRRDWLARHRVIEAVD
jgi:lysozyme